MQTFQKQPYSCIPDVYLKLFGVSLQMSIVLCAFSFVCSAVWYLFLLSNYLVPVEHPACR